MTLKNKKTVSILSVISAMALVAGASTIPSSMATTSHTCTTSAHCYATQWLQWELFGLYGNMEEYGVESNLDVASMTDADQKNNFIVNAMWILKRNDATKWVELGVIRGDYPDCPSDAETTKRYYWVSWDGSYHSNGTENISGGCVTSPNVSSQTIKIDDTNKDGTWKFIVGSTTIKSHSNNFGKGNVKIGLESTSSSNTANAKFTNLKYHDNSASSWKNWEHSANQEVGNYAITKCSATSYKVGSAAC